MTLPVRRLSEFELIARVTQDLPLGPGVIVGVGDDCAVVAPCVDQDWLLKTDAVVEGVHFERGAGFERIGRKALARCLSDIAAMGGKPHAALVTLALPDNHQIEEVEALYAGIRQLADRYGVSVVGGETTRNPERYLISISLTGTVPKGKCARRSGARVGDAIFVTGELGGSIEGRHLDFEPRLEEGAWLAGEFGVHAMMDLSDGLAGDLRHILQASGLGAELLGSAIPVSRTAKLRGRGGDTAKPPLLAALTDGEDFELVFTVSAAAAVRLVDAWKIRFPSLRLSCIGKIVEKPGLRLRDQRGIRELSAHGYVHFKES